MHAISLIRPAHLLAIVFFLFCGTTELCAQTTADLQEGTTVRVRLLETLDTGSKPNVGEQITFEVADDVEFNGQVLVRSGARATGTITESVKAKWGGRKGKLDFTIDYVQAVDGQNIRVRSTANRVKGKGNVGLMAAGTVLLSPVAVFIRGKNAVVDKGTEFSVYVDETRTVGVN